MSTILDALRAGVKVADEVTKPAQSKVRYRRYLSSDGLGGKTYSAVKLLSALVDWKQEQVRTKEGVLSVSRAMITFLNVKELLLATANNGIDDNDEIVLPDGTTGPILDMSGFIDPGTSIPLATQVYLG